MPRFFTVSHFVVGTAVCAALASSFAHADVRVAGEIGTTGVGFHATVPLNADFSARVGLGYLGYGYRDRTRDVEYDLSLKTRTYDALLDWYPGQDSNFRLTTGLSYNGNQIDVQARPASGTSLVLAGNAYDATRVGSVEGNVRFNKLAPYLGVGWGGRSSREKDEGWAFSADVGVLFQGSPQTSLRNVGCMAGAAVCGQLASDLVRENDALYREVKVLRFYPVLRVGLSYKF